MSVNDNVKTQSLQDMYLNKLRKEKVPVVVYLTNGIRLRGIIKGFDNFVVMLKGSTSQLIYKHAISTILPEKEVEPDFE
ncbi:MAG: RNA chaperone Hfq [Nitrospiraceae bacterium]|nr:RNA chaperone Hfq [Nitrospiraceae bacterium]MDA8326343.1 RNA chaperone Hfq [Nitrospiraceae bacterium]